MSEAAEIGQGNIVPNEMPTIPLVFHISHNCDNCGETMIVEIMVNGGMGNGALPLKALSEMDMKCGNCGTHWVTNEIELSEW